MTGRYRVIASLLLAKKLLHLSLVIIVVLYWKLWRVAVYGLVSSDRPDTVISHYVKQSMISRRRKV